VESLRRLAVRAVFEYKIFKGVADLQKEAFQAVEENEEARANNGFTGFRKVLVVSWAM
jgi:hypothetical protein